MGVFKGFATVMHDLFGCECDESQLDWVMGEPVQHQEPILIRSQKELDKLPDDEQGPLILLGDIGSQFKVKRNFKKGILATAGCFIDDYGDNVILCRVGCIVSAYGQSKIVMLDNGLKTVHLWDKAQSIGLEQAKRIIGEEALWAMVDSDEDYGE